MPATKSGDMMKDTTFVGLRGYLALWVVIRHTLWACGFHYNGEPYRLSLSFLALQSDAAVRIFMILSGFVVTRLLLHRGETPVPFLIRRVFRIFPAYLVALGLAILCLGTFSEIWPSLPFKSPHQEIDVANFDYAAGHLTKEVMNHFFLVQTVLRGDSNYALLGPAWTLSLEWQFYLLAPVLASLLRRWPVAVLCTGMAVTVALQHASHYDLMLAVYGQLFWIGIISAMIFDNAGLRMVLATLHPRHMVLLVLLWFSVGGMNGNNIDILVWAVAFIVALREQAGGSGVLGWLFTNRVMVFSGTASYSIYLLHMFCLLLTLMIVAPLASLGQGPYTIIVFGLTLVTTYCTAALSLSLVEMPGIALGKMVAARWKTLLRREQEAT
jgi:peptidoglycan/LPS O-acetylase OafA/YrhL